MIIWIQDVYKQYRLKKRDGNELGFIVSADGKSIRKRSVSCILLIFVNDFNMAKERRRGFCLGCFTAPRYAPALGIGSV